MLMNMQGVFLFLFHCARNEQMREQWRSAFSTTDSTASKYTMKTSKAETSGSEGNPNGMPTSEKPQNGVTMSEKPHHGTPDPQFEGRLNGTSSFAKL